MKRFAEVLCAAVALGAILSTGAGAARAGDWGPAIGSPAPAFELSDQQGRVHTLDSLLGRRVLAIVFYRSADW
jgi:cytochrome oxidase Cu insertion factor (SCO1/SenC/PrrC family)